MAPSVQVVIPCQGTAASKASGLAWSERRAARRVTAGAERVERQIRPEGNRRIVEKFLGN